MRILLLIILLFSAGGYAISQDNGFSELSARLENLGNQQQIEALKEFLNKFPDTGPACFRLAQLYSSAYKKSDKFREFEFVKAAASEANRYYQKLAVMIEEGNGVDFADLLRLTREEKLSMDSLKSIIEIELSESQNLLEKLPPVYNNLVKAGHHYGMAVDLYAELTGNYGNVNELLMLYDEDLESNLVLLGAYYDSTLWFLNEYFRLGKEYDTGYDQKYFVQPIDWFRYQGLVESVGFLEDEFRVWDYKLWVKTIMEEYAEKIIPLKEALIAEDERLENAGNAQYQVFADRLLLQELNRRSPGSPLITLFHFRQFMNDFENVHQYQALFDTVSSAKPINKLMFYSTVFNKALEGANWLDTLEENLDGPGKVQHDDFFRVRFGGIAGLRNFIQEKRNYFIEVGEESVENLYIEAKKEVPVPELDSAITAVYRRIKIPVFPNMEKEFADQSPLTTLKAESIDGAVYLAGVLPEKSGSVAAFVARVYNGRAEWMNEYILQVDSLNSKSINRPTSLLATREGVALIIHSNSVDGSASRNTMMVLNVMGDRKLKSYLGGITEFTRNMWYNDASNSFIIVARGNQFQQRSASEEVMRVVSVDSKGKVLWLHNSSFKGDFYTIVPFTDHFLTVSNYVSEAGRKAPYLIKWAYTGAVLEEKPLGIPFDFEIKHLLKLSNESAIILGESGSQIDNSEYLHVIIDAFLNITYLKKE